MPGDLRRFEDVAHLESPQLRELLGSPDPEQRVWAIWGLALRIGRDSELADLIAQVSREPVPGVRRMLVVVLAGHGELDLVVALGHHDPAVEVRAQAMQLVTRLAAASDAHADASAPSITTAVVIERFAREVSGVRAAMLDAIPHGAPAWLERLAHDALRAEPEVQLEAFEAVLRLGTAASLQRAVLWIAKARGELALRAWGRWPHVMPTPELVRMLAATPAALRVAAIRMLPGVPIEELAPLTLLGGRGIFEAIRDRPDFPATPIEVIARAILASYADRYVELLAERLATPLELTPELIATVRGLRTHCAARRATALQGGVLLPDERPSARRWPAYAQYDRAVAACDRVLGP